MRKLKNFILKYFPVDKFRYKSSYSQEGEDAVLLGFYEGLKNYKGYYVDIGAHHPYRFSNTIAFYKRGWRGINIEPNPSALKWFKLFRSKDINLNIGVGPELGNLTYYRFNEPALNGFSEEISNDRNEKTRYYIIDKLEIPVQPLSYVLDTYLPADQTIDFFSVDVEGFDLLVLQSNNWEKYSPKFVLVEDVFSEPEFQNSPIANYLKERNYRIVAKTKRTVFFALQK